MMREVIARAIATGGLNPDECAGLVIDAISEAGFVIAPKEPTEAMHDAGETWIWDNNGAVNVSLIYRAMITEYELLCFTPATDNNPAAKP